MLCCYKQDRGREESRVLSKQSAIILLVRQTLSTRFIPTDQDCLPKIQLKTAVDYFHSLKSRDLVASLRLRGACMTMIMYIIHSI